MTGVQRNAIEQIKGRLKREQKPMERAWIAHELARTEMDVSA